MDDIEGVAAQRLSTAGVRFIGGFEGFRGRLYNDPLGHCSIGFGHLVHHGRCNGTEPARFRKGITRQQALALMRQDAARFEKCLNRHVRVGLSQPRFDALLSFAFNVGTGAFEESTLLRRLNKGQYGAVPSELMRWTNRGLAGLVRRRRAEGALFRDGRYVIPSDDEEGVGDDVDAGDISEGDLESAEPPAEVEEGPADEGRHEPPGENPEDVGEPTDEPDTEENEAVPADERLLRAMKMAIDMGLRIASTNAGEHAPSSYHVRPACGPVVVAGRRYTLCRAFDVALPGDQASLYERYFHALEAMRPAELFYDPMGYSWKNGRRVDWIAGAHDDHVHVAF